MLAAWLLLSPDMQNQMQELTRLAPLALHKTDSLPIFAVSAAQMELSDIQKEEGPLDLECSGRAEDLR